MSAPAASAPISGASQNLVVRDCIYHGFSFRETAGSTAVVRLRSGGVVTGPILETISLVGSESTGDWFEDGVMCPTGLYVQIVSGTVEGAVRYK